jgi:hypothetical protein
MHLTASGRPQLWDMDGHAEIEDVRALAGVHAVDLPPQMADQWVAEAGARVDQRPVGTGRRGKHL